MPINLLALAENSLGYIIFDYFDLVVIYQSAAMGSICRQAFQVPRLLVPLLATSQRHFIILVHQYYIPTTTQNPWNANSIFLDGDRDLPY